MTMQQVRMLVVEAARGPDGCCKTCGMHMPTTETELAEMNLIAQGGQICQSCNPA